MQKEIKWHDRHRESVSHALGRAALGLHIAAARARARQKIHAMSWTSTDRNVRAALNHNLRRETLGAFAAFIKALALLRASNTRLV